MKSINRLSKYLRGFLKVVGWIIASIVGLILLIAVILAFPQTQEFLTGKLENYLEEKLETNVEIGGVYLTFPKSVLVKDLYVEDREQDTLVYSGRLQVNADLLGLLSKKMGVSKVSVSDFYGRIERTSPDTTFNFNFIIESFSSDSAAPEAEQAPQEDTSGGWEISFGGLELENFRFEFKDEMTGSHAYVDLGELAVGMDEVDLANNAYSVRNIQLENTSGFYRITKFTPDTAASEDTSALELSVGRIAVSQTEFEFDNQPSGQKISLNVGEFLAVARAFSLARQEALLDELKLHDTHITYAVNPASGEDSLEIAQADTASAGGGESEPWRVEADIIDLAGNRLQYDDFNYPALASGMDFNHLLIDGLTLEARDLHYSDMDIAANIRQLAFREKSGFTLKEFTTQLTFGETEAALEDLYVNTGSSVIQRRLAAQYPSLAAIGDRLGEVVLDIDISNTVVGFRDILYFSPGLAGTPPFAGNENLTLRADARITGAVSDLTLERLAIRALNNTSAVVSGDIAGLPDMDRAFFNFHRFRLQSADGDLQRLFVPDSIAQQYDLPGSLTLTAGFRGTLQDFSAHTALNTSMGNISADISMDPGQKYAGSLSVDSLQLGSLMRNDTTFGPVSLSAQVNGEGFSLDSMKAQIDLLVEHARFNRYNYRGLTVNGAIDQSVFNGRIAYEDSSLNFDFEGLASLDADTPRYDLTLDIKGADLKALNLVPDELTVQAALTADMTGDNINNINGDIGVRDVLVVKNGQTYRVDSLIYASVTDREQTQINLDSDFLSAEFKGAINLGDLVPVLQRHFQQYYNVEDPPAADNLRPQNFEFEIELRDPQLLTEVLVPDIETFVPGHITGSYNSLESQLTLDFLIPQIVYQSFTVDTLTVHVDSDSSFLNFGASIARFGFGAYEMQNLAVVGQVYDNLIETRLQITDHQSEEQYGLGGVFSSVDGANRFSFTPEEIVLNYNVWNLPSDNYVEFSDKPMFVHQMILTRNNQQFAVNTAVSEERDSVLNVNFENFRLEAIANLIESDTAVLSGILNGNFDLRQDAPQLVFTSDMSINSLAFMGAPIGDLAVMAENTGGDRISLDARLTGNDNDVVVAGYYQANGETNDLNLTADLNRVNLAAFSGPLQGTLSELEGYIDGGLQITGSTEQPNITGSLDFNETHFFVEYLQTSFNIDNEQIVFNNSGIRFNQFQIIDISDNEAVINGAIRTPNYSDFSFDLTVNANHFEVLNTDANDNQLYYGHVVIDAEAGITGSMVSPEVQLDLAVKPETNLTYALPESMPATIEVEGLVRFVSREGDGPNAIIADAKEEQQYDTLSSELTGMNLTANIEVEQNATLEIIIDPAAGDRLVTRANPSSLSLNIDQVGNMNLTGSFEIADGSYQLSFYDFVRRRLEIMSGSRITWVGNPLDANIDITAIYTVETSPSPIMPGEDPAFARVLPVQVLLNIEGELMDPEISFDLGVSEEVATGLAAQVRPRLQGLTEAERNKQVFALLVLQRFIAENPLESSGGGGLEATARNSVSKILNSQLNKLSQRIQGFNLEFDLQSYETAEGAQTQLDVSLSKSLFNDRLNIKVGGNIDIEEQNQAQSSRPGESGLADYVGDIVIEYKLTPNGNLLLQFFREQSYETFYNELIETGVGFIYTREYNRFKELLNPRDDEDEEEAEQETEEETEEDAQASK